MKNNPVIAMLVTVSLIMTKNVSFSQKANQIIPFDTGTRMGKLANGFTYYIRRNLTPEKKAVFYLINKVGSVLETEKQQGLAHLLEHMAFNGTVHFPKTEIINYLQNKGVRIGADVNAYTDFNETVFQLPIPINDKKLFKNAFYIIRDWAQGITLEDEEINKEKGVILAEMRQHSGAAQRIKAKTKPYLFNRSIYAQRPPLGKQEVIKSFKNEDLRSFYQDWYRPDLQAIVIAGDININEVEDMIVAIFSNLKNPSERKIRPQFTIPLDGKNQFVTVTDPEVPTTQVEITIKHPRNELKTRDDFRRNLLRKLFNTMATNRINELLAQDKVPFLAANVNIGKFVANLDAFVSRMNCDGERLENALKAYWIELMKIKKYGFTRYELQKAKTALLSGIELNYKERDKRPSENYAKECLAHFLEGIATPGQGYEMQMYKTMIPEITAEEIQLEIVNKYLTQQNRDIIIVCNTSQKHTLPNEQQFLNWLKQIEQKPLDKYLGTKPVRLVLMNNLPPPGRIIAEQSLEDIGIRELILANGIKILLKPTNFKEDQIVFRGFSLGGLSIVNDLDFYEGRLAADLVNMSGVANHSPLELENILVGKNLNVTPYIEDISQGIEGTSTKKDLETALQLVYLYLTSPRKDSTTFTHLKNQIKLTNHFSKTIPTQIFQDTIQAVMGNYHFRKMKMPESRIDALNLDKILKIYKDRFADVSGMNFILTGSFNVDSVKPLLIKYLGAIPALHRHETIRNLRHKYPSGRISKKIAKGNEPKAIVFLSYSGSFDYHIKNILQMRALSNILKTRLITKLREDQGGIYTADVSLIANKLPSGQYNYAINFVCAPKNTEALILLVNAEIINLKEHGPSIDEINKYISTEKGIWSSLLISNDFWRDYITGKLMYGEKLKFPEVGRIEKELSIESQKDTAIRFFSNQNYVKLVLVPESGK
ncbi:peptidase M16 [Pedobacter sp. KBW06]|uniref:M16 family metallopeptidase n=1 Tax=Pedobacter sp. KBW06 TaxID=2153359 RepID=UPI000F5AC6A4|nr:M16 family metallopeptidase [Pedobacter sp. KBW06]RQO75659.1 peptidase M16 [Pedobacter sp. KBW06]